MAQRRRTYCHYLSHKECIIPTICNNFTIFTDSKSALVALQNFYPNNPIILDIFYTLRQVFEKGKSITFCCSPGHVNIQGNEDADKADKSTAARNKRGFEINPIFGYQILF